jgi:hypothetical protein
MQSVHKLAVILAIILPGKQPLPIPKEPAVVPVIQPLAFADSVNGRVDVHLAAIDFAPKVNDADVLEDVELALNCADVRLTKG